MSDSASTVHYFGRLDVAGHSLHCKSGPHLRIDETPWGNNLDTGLLSHVADRPDGQYVTAIFKGWTAVSFWDRSGDSRPGSNSAFVIHAEMEPEKLLAFARLQWPEVFRRLPFQLKRWRPGC